jgi:hypothetical protein
MGSWRNAYGRLGAAALVLAIAAGCTSSSATWPPVRPSAVGPVASGVHVVVPDESGAHASQPVASGAPRATATSATVDQITADYTYKSELITPIAHLYGTFLDDFVIVTIDNGNSSPVKVTVQSNIAGYTDKASDTVTVAAKGTEEIRQNPRLTQAGYDSLNSQHPAELSVVVSYLESGQPRTILDQTSETTITSRDDFPWTIKGFTQQENYDLVVAMITPTDPSVNALIRTARNYDPSGAMTSGYDSDMDANGTVAQRLSDIWQAEASDYKLAYISTPITFASGSSQRIRLPGEVLDQSSGNCIELTLLYAAAVEFLGMQPALVIVPGHAYVAVRIDGKNDSFYFIETTMIGSATFSEALKEGLSEWQTAQPHVAQSEADYGWVDVPEARSNGIVPIPWR